MSFFWQNNQAIGMDISDLTIKIVQLEKNGDKIKIKAVGKTDLAPGIIEKGEIKNKEELIKNIRQLLSRPNYGKVTTDEVVVCLPETKTFLKIIEVDKNAADFSEAVLKESEKHIPLPKEDIYYDWQIIKENIRTKTVLIGATPKKLTDEYLNILKEAKLIATVLENEQLSVCRCLLPEENPKYKEEKAKNYAILDIGATEVSMTVYAKNTILFSVSMPISGEEITHKIAQDLNIKPDEAEKAKITYGLKNEEEQSEIKEIMTEMINNLIFKSREALNFYNNHFSSWGQMNQIILCGGGANIKDIEKTIEKQLNISTVKGNALINLGGKEADHLKAFKKNLGLRANFDSHNSKQKSQKEEKTLELTQETTLIYATAIGLALRGVFN